MRSLDGRIFLSASDLMRFTGCAHATTLDLAYLQERDLTPREDSEDALLLQKLGDAHELAHLKFIKDGGRSVTEIARSGLVKDAEATRAALAEGPEVVFQGAFLSGIWGGWSAFEWMWHGPSLAWLRMIRRSRKTPASGCLHSQP